MTNDRISTAGAVARRLALGLVASLAVALLAAAPAAATSAWLAPVSLPGAESVGETQVGMDAGGDVVAVFQGGTATSASAIQAADRPAGGPWEKPVAISSLDIQAYGPQLAVNARGDAVASWVVSTGAAFGGPYFVQAAVRLQSGAWGAPVSISDAMGEPASSAVAIDARGAATVVWGQALGGGSTVMAAVWRAGGGWQRPVPVSEPGTEQPVAPDVAVDAQGVATVVWDQFPCAAPTLIQSATRAATGQWAAPVDVASAAGTADLPTGQYNCPYSRGSDPQVAVDARGDATVVWHDSAGTGYAMRPAGGGWGSPGRFDGADRATSGNVVIDDDGVATAIWVQNPVPNVPDYIPAQGYVVRTAQLLPRTQAVAPPVDLWTARFGAQSNIAVNPRGDVIAGWGDDTRFDVTTLVAVRPRGAAWQPPTQLHIKGGAPLVALDAQGDGIALWRGLQSAGYDAAPPVFAALKLPSVATLGRSVSLSASPVDVWSHHVTSWAFGDGGTAAGTRAKHTYTRRGSFAVVLRSVDRLGNAAVVTSTIRVRPLAKVTQLRVSRAAFRASRSGPAVNPRARSRSSTVVSYVLNTAAGVRLSVQRIARGRFVAIRGSFTRRRVAGRDRLTFSGRVGGRTLAPGSYRLSATPTANGEQGRTVHARLRITA